MTLCGTAAVAYSAASRLRTRSSTSPTSTTRARRPRPESSRTWRWRRRRWGAAGERCQGPPAQAGGFCLCGVVAEPLLLVHGFVRHLDQGVHRIVLIGLRLRNPDTELQSIRTRPCVVAVVDVLPHTGQGHLDPFLRLRQQVAKLIAPPAPNAARLAQSL